ncbi:hypothetical protein ACB098_10G003700 [Castanea mollissima]
MKKRTRADEDEEKLELIEDSHIKSRTSADTTPQTTSSSEDSSSDGTTSTSDDDDNEFHMSEDDGVDTSKAENKIEQMGSDNGNGERVKVEAEAQPQPQPQKNCNGHGNGERRIMGPRFKDFGGIDSVIEELKMEVIVPLYHRELPRCLGVQPMSGILLHGPPGCGKTKLAQAIANETGFPFHMISSTGIISAVSAEENIQQLFSRAYNTAPSILFIDEIDAIGAKRENLRDMERRIVSQLITCMDVLQRLYQAHAKSNSESSNTKPGYVLVIGATNRPDALDPALRMPGRFDREIAIGVPNESGRLEILSVLTRNLKLEGSFNILNLARSTPGFVGADLAALANKAGNLAMKRIIDERKSELSKGSSINEEHSEEWWRQPWMPEEMEKLAITMADFEEAVKMVQPSSRREGFSTIPNVKWEDIGGLDFLRKEFERYIVRRIKHPEDYEGLGLDLDTGFLLYGPPGCGKTLIAKAVANEAGANFIHIKGPELLNKYVGESELAVRTLFRRARTCSPCILFFDEVDALTTNRGTEGGWIVERLLNQLLIELDGAEQRRGVFVIGATNRPEMMDRAILRPGRFGKLLYVPLPSPDERGKILKALARKKPIDASVDLSSIGRMEACENFSGADLGALMNEAAMVALEDRLKSTDQSTLGATSLTIKSTHFEQAVGQISRSVLDKQKQYYQMLSENLKAA